MSIVLQVLDTLIAAAEKADDKLHAGLERLREIRTSLTTFGGGEDADELVRELRNIANEAE